MDLGLSAKVAVITGGSEGIGKGIALRFLQERAKVAICARRDDVMHQAAEELRASTSGDLLAVSADVTNPETLTNLINRVVDHFGRIDILVNNAGRSATSAFDELTDDAWYADLDLKLMGAVRCARLVIPQMKLVGGGRIINITHPGGKHPGAASYPTSVSRAAGIAMTKALSKELLPHNILVNTVCLTSIKSTQGERAWKAEGERGTLDEYWIERAKEHPLGRLGEPSDAGALVAFLASECASFITGTAINLDGGLSNVV